MSNTFKKTVTFSAALVALGLSASVAGAADNYLTCGADNCYTSPAPLPDNVNESTTWSPCGGAPFWWYGSINLEQGYDELIVDGEIFTGQQSISGRAIGATTISVSTDDSVSSEGVLFLGAICDDNTTYLEAECPDTKQGSYATVQTSGTGYSGNGYVTSVGNTTAEASSTDRATHSFRTSAGSFNVYFRANTNASADDDSWFYRIDGGGWVTMNNYTSSGWNWIKKSTATTLAEGTHTLEVRNRESGLKLDKLAILPATDPAPADVGGEAFNCQPDVSCSGDTCTDGDICVVADLLPQGACMPFGNHASGTGLGSNVSARLCDSHTDCGAGKRCAKQLQGNVGVFFGCIAESELSNPNVFSEQLCGSPAWSSPSVCKSPQVCAPQDGAGYRVCRNP